MAWIKVHQELLRHPKLLRLASKLGIKKSQAVGHLVCLWCWALDFAQDGNLTNLVPNEIKFAGDWDGDAEEFLEGLVCSGFLDMVPETEIRIHDWEEYAGNLIFQRQKNKERMRLSRERATHERRTLRERSTFVTGLEKSREEKRRVYSKVREKTEDRGVGEGTNVFEEKFDVQPQQSQEKKLDTTLNAFPATPAMSFFENDSEPSQDQNPLPGKTPAGQSGTSLEDAEKIYQVYPRKVGKPAAIRAIISSLKRTGTTIEECFALVSKYSKAKEAEDPQFIPHPSTFFNQDRYLDDPVTWKTNHRGNSTRCQVGSGCGGGEADSDDEAAFNGLAAKLLSVEAEIQEIPF